MIYGQNYLQTDYSTCFGEKKKKKSQESQSARGQIMKRQRGKKSSNKYETANYSLSSVGNNQFYGSGSLWSRRQLYEE